MGKFCPMSFEGFLAEVRDDATWFLESPPGPIINNGLVSKGRVLGGIACTRRVSKAHLRLHVETSQARVRDLESATIVREGYTYEEISRMLSHEREQWQRDWESQATTMEREKS